MSYLRGIDRGQQQLLPPSVEEYVAAEAPVRFIHAFVEELDLTKLGFERTEAAGTGRPPYAPGDLLKLYVYGYLQRVRSSRRLEAEAQRNLEVIWLLRGLRPDFKTIADFRKDNRKCFKEVFKAFNLLCRKLELFGAELVAIDGSKFKAVNSPKRHYSAKQLPELVQRIEAKIEEYLGNLDTEDQAVEGVAGQPRREELQAKIEALKQRRGRYEQLERELSETGQSEVSLTDPDSRGMKKVNVGYNVQVAVDAKHDLIVEAAVVQAANDLGQLHPMAVAAKEALGVAQLKAVADAGYHEANQLEKCEQSVVSTYVSVPGTRSGQNRAGKIYPKQAFVYDQAAEAYHCPAGQLLKRGHVSSSEGRKRIYYYNTKACSGCAQKAQCTMSRYRRIWRLPNEEVVERQAVRTAAHPEIIKRRKCIVEHVFGTLRLWGHDAFLCRSLEKVQAEFSLSALAYNLRRALNLLGLRELMAGLRSAN